MRTHYRLLTVAVIALCVWLAVDYHYVRSGQPEHYAPASWGVLFFPAVFAGFLWGSWRLFPSHATALRLFGRALVALTALLLWAGLSAFVVVQFHQVLGGEL